LKTERFAMAYRLLPTYAFVRPESEQNCSLGQINGSLAPLYALFLFSHQGVSIGIGNTAEAEQSQSMLATKMGAFVEGATKKSPARGTGFVAPAEG
jgi:hypothetical protein